MSGTRVHRLIELLWSAGEGTEVYALLDGARDRDIAPLVRLSRLHHACLYSGHVSARLQAAAPWLVILAPDATFTAELLARGWGQAWGCFLRVPPDVSLRRQREHFRELLRVRDEDGRRLLFRFYDPRVLRAWLPTCTAAELDLFFGPVPNIVAESEDGRSLTSWTRSEAGLHTERVPVA